MPATKTPPGHQLTAILGPTNTGKTHLAVERMLGHSSGMIGLPLRLLAREIYDRVVAVKGKSRAALITGEEKIVPENAAYFIATVEAMPLGIPVAFLAIDEIQLAADPERGHVFTNRLLHARGLEETMVMGSATIEPLVRSLLPEAQIIRRPRFSELSYVTPKKIGRLPKRTAVIAFTMENVYATAEVLRRTYGGAAVVMGALSPKTRNAQVEMFQAGEVNYIVATDAIGMGLNMDIDHVVFAEVEKFDGKRRRKLFPHELAQIAGRAGRHLNSGTFTTLAEMRGPELTPQDVAKIENHSFQTLKSLMWRNAALNFRTPSALVKSLEEPSGHAMLTKAGESLDLQALRTLVQGGEVLSGGPEAVQRLWEVCQIPDFLGISENFHFSLLNQIHGFLASPEGVIPHDWMAAQVSKLDNVQGNIENLMQKIAAIRTWTYISHRSGWLKEAEHWAHVTRSLEDKLSAALHERLSQRFVDKRTSLLMKNIQGSDLMIKVDKDGAVSLEDQELGTLKGFCFHPISDMDGEDAKITLKLAEKHLRPVVKEKAVALLKAEKKALSLDLPSGSGRVRILLDGEAVATLTKGQRLLSPGLELSGSPLLVEKDAKALRECLQGWVKAQLEAHLEPLVVLNRAVASAKSALPGLTRGLAFRMVENLGVSAKSLVQDDLKNLTAEDRKALHKFGFWFGAHFVYLPKLLKPAPTKWRLALWGLWQGIKAWPALPEDGVMWTETLKATPKGFYQTLGYHPIGNKVAGKAVRIDRLEKLADAVRPLGMDYNFFVVSPETMGLVGLSGPDFAAVMNFLGYVYKEETLPLKEDAEEGDEPKVQYSFKWGPKKPGGAKTAQKGSKKASGPKKPPAKKVTVEDSPFAELKNLKFGKSRP